MTVRTSLSRTSLKLTATTAKAQASLDARSVFALEYAQGVLHKAGGLSVPASGVVRRALEVYIRHLEQEEDHVHEFHRVAAACKAWPMSPQDHHEAAARFSKALASLQPGGKPEPFRALLRGPNAPDEAALTAEAEALAHAVMRSFIRPRTKKGEA